MLIALDTSTSWISLALFDGTYVRYESTWESQHHHTVELAPAINRVFKQTGTSPQDLTGIAVAIGPGSFTSLRIGLALTKGMSLALNIPMAGVPSLDVIASAQPLDERPMIAVLHAGRRRLAYATYQVQGGAWAAQDDPQVIEAKDLVKTIDSPTLVCGELSEEARVIIGRRWKNAILAPPERCVRRAGFLAALGWERLAGGGSDDPVSLAPIYLSTTNPIPD
ncbi:MAG: tRNA (adenosine(37)-N6)-threonylcarbamoyltransferase complex dimerization subunit type 1 TsaB [Brevefilum sp.]|nr:tRNA (adenosine(37)-N6)-threonylcarbamoyltransferase complex dimerization subunit type 1 TsaB [Brevefilum sp.]